MLVPAPLAPSSLLQQSLPKSRTILASLVCQPNVQNTGEQGKAAVETRADAIVIVSEKRSISRRRQPRGLTSSPNSGSMIRGPKVTHPATRPRDCSLFPARVAFQQAVPKKSCGLPPRGRGAMSSSSPRWPRIKYCSSRLPSGVTTSAPLGRLRRRRRCGARPLRRPHGRPPQAPAFKSSHRPGNASPHELFFSVAPKAEEEAERHTFRSPRFLAPGWGRRDEAPHG